MFRNVITRQLTPASYVALFMLFWVAVVLVRPTITVPQILVLFAIWCAVAAFLAWMNHRHIQQRHQTVAAFAAANNLQFVQSYGAQFLGALGAINRLHNARDQKVENIVVGSNWAYGDFSYRLYMKTKHGDIPRTTVFYGVFSMQLPRGLPNVFFDSKKARRRQFRFHFSSKQRHSLEGDFDRFFVTYFPAGYTIDSLSFITPEVMWALRFAADYDIEIYGNRLFLYGPLYDPAQQLPDMTTKATAIKRALLNNILTYRDTRLPYAQGRQGVAIEGAELHKSRFWTMVTITAVIIWIILDFYL